LSFLLTALGLGLGSHMYSLEGFQMIVSFVVFPLFFLSGALYPLDNLPDWLYFLTIIDPATYAVDALRNSILGIATYSFEFNLLLLLVSTIITTLFGMLSFRKMRAV
jgi:ABC-2 type transport system permease protein